MIVGHSCWCTMLCIDYQNVYSCTLHGCYCCEQQVRCTYVIRIHTRTSIRIYLCIYCYLRSTRSLCVGRYHGNRAREPSGHRTPDTGWRRPSLAVDYLYLLRITIRVYSILRYGYRFHCQPDGYCNGGGLGTSHMVVRWTKWLQQTTGHNAHGPGFGDFNRYFRPLRMPVDKYTIGITLHSGMTLNVPLNIASRGDWGWKMEEYRSKEAIEGASSL